MHRSLAALRRTLAGADAALAHLERGFIGAALAFAALLLFTNVALRYVVLQPISWAEELVLYLMVWIVFVGGSAVMRARAHVAIDLLPQILRGRWRRALEFVVYALTSALLLTLCIYGARHALRVGSTGQLTPVMQAPMWLAYLAVPVGSALMLLQSLKLTAAALLGADDSAAPAPRQD